MQKIVEKIPGHDSEIYGVGADSIITAVILLILIVILRQLTGILIPKIFTSVSVGSTVAKEALSNSGKALGFAVGSWGGMHLVEQMAIPMTDYTLSRIFPKISSTSD